MLKKIDFKSGQVILNDFDFDDTIPLEEQIFSFKHDIFQVKYNNDLILDLGWLPMPGIDWIRLYSINSSARASIDLSSFARCSWY